MVHPAAARTRNIDDGLRGLDRNQGLVFFDLVAGLNMPAYDLGLG